MEEFKDLELIEVESSNIKAIGYKEKEKTLYVNFKSATLYGYYGVPRELFDDFLKADSKGKFLNSEIKGRYAYLRLA